MFLVRNSVPAFAKAPDGLKIILSHNRLKQGKTVKITDSPKRIVKSELKVNHGFAYLSRQPRKGCLSLRHIYWDFSYMGAENDTDMDDVSIRRWHHL